jgi:hypothetical protein
MSAGGHLFHAILTILFFPWALVWLVCAISSGNSRKKKYRELMERQTKAIEEMNKINTWRGYRD